MQTATCGRGRRRLSARPEQTAPARLAAAAALLAVLLSAAVAAALPSPAVALAALDPRVVVAGRTERASEGVSFDWPTSFHVNVGGSASLWMNVSCSARWGGRVAAKVRDSRSDGTGPSAWLALSQAWVDANVSGSVLKVASGLPLDGVTRLLRIEFDSEPLFSGTSGGGASGPWCTTAADECGQPSLGVGLFTVHGFLLEAGGVFGPPMPPYTRKIEIVGDSNSAGMGSGGLCSGTGAMSYAWSSGATPSFHRKACDYFGANCSVLAYSALGVGLNPVGGIASDLDTLSTMYLRSRAGTKPPSAAWDFASFVPDLIIINAGGNDIGRRIGLTGENLTRFNNAYVAYYTAFVVNATRRYGNVALPVILATVSDSHRLPEWGGDWAPQLVAVLANVNAAGGRASMVYIALGNATYEGCSTHLGPQQTFASFELLKPAVTAATGWPSAPAQGPYPIPWDDAPPAGSGSVPASGGCSGCGGAFGAGAGAGFAVAAVLAASCAAALREHGKAATASTFPKLSRWERETRVAQLSAARL